MTKVADVDIKYIEKKEEMGEVLHEIEAKALEVAKSGDSTRIEESDFFENNLAKNEIDISRDMAPRRFSSVMFRDFRTSLIDIQVREKLGRFYEGEDGKYLENAIMIVEGCSRNVTDIATMMNELANAVELQSYDAGHSRLL